MQRRLHPLEGIVALFALFLVLALTVGFAQAGELGAAPRAQKVVLLRSSAVLVQDADTGEVVINKNSEAVVPIADRKSTRLNSSHRTISYAVFCLKKKKKQKKG